MNAGTLGWDNTATWLVTNALGYLNGTAGSLAGHDYVNVGGALTLNHFGRVVVSSYGSVNYSSGDVFNLFDWSTLSSSGFTLNSTPYNGTGDSGFDLDLPTLGSGLFWDTSLFTSHGVVFIIPEPSRALLLMFGLLMLFFRRRRD